MSDDSTRAGCGCVSNLADIVLDFGSLCAGGYNGYCQAKGIPVHPPLTEAMLWYLPAVIGGGFGAIGGAVGGGLLGTMVGGIRRETVGGAVGGGAAGTTIGAAIGATLNAAKYTVINAVGYGIGYAVGHFTK